VHTWEEKQGSLLSAIEIEKGILNVLLFFIIGVAGFGILAIFSMIVPRRRATWESSRLLVRRTSVCCRYF